MEIGLQSKNFKIKDCAGIIKEYSVTYNNRMTGVSLGNLKQTSA